MIGNPILAVKRVIRHNRLLRHLLKPNPAMRIPVDRFNLIPRELALQDSGLDVLWEPLQDGGDHCQELQGKILIGSGTVIQTVNRESSRTQDDSDPIKDSLESQVPKLLFGFQFENGVTFVGFKACGKPHRLSGFALFELDYVIVAYIENNWKCSPG